jgi:hypothetical protein
MIKAYRQGFVEKCAECGVDPDRLVKQAQIMKFLAGLGKPLEGVGAAIRSLGSSSMDAARGSLKGVAGGYFHRLLGGNLKELNYITKLTQAQRHALLRGMDSVRAAGRPELMEQFRRPLQSMSHIYKRDMAKLLAERAAVFKTRLKTGLGLGGAAGIYGLYSNSRPDPDADRWSSYMYDVD